MTAPTTDRMAQFAGELALIAHTDGMHAVPAVVASRLPIDQWPELIAVLAAMVGTDETMRELAQEPDPESTAVQAAHCQYLDLRAKGNVTDQMPLWVVAGEAQYQRAMQARAVAA